MSVDKIPTTIITGFLGAGKTTLVRYLIEHAEGKRLALIVNEFGDVGVDGDLLRACGNENCREEDIVELANGCICCTVADDFLPTMHALLAREPRPDHIIIETSGLALPQPLIKAFRWPDIRANTSVDGVITVVDGEALARGHYVTDEKALAAQRAADEALDHDSPIEELFEDQIRAADLVVITKIDKMTEAEIGRVETLVGENARPGTGTLKAASGKLSPALLLGLDMRAEDDIEQRPTHHELAGFEDHDHDDFTSFALRLPSYSDAEGLIDRLKQVIESHHILRIKGFLAVDGKTMRLAVQAVGPRVDHWYDQPWPSGKEPASHLVVIGEAGLDQAAIEAALR